MLGLVKSFLRIQFAKFCNIDNFDLQGLLGNEKIFEPKISNTQGYDICYFCSNKSIDFELDAQHYDVCFPKEQWERLVLI